jgi:hypothetical protein
MIIFMTIWASPRKKNSDKSLFFFAPSGYSLQPHFFGGGALCTPPPKK